MLGAFGGGRFVLNMNGEYLAFQILTQKSQFIFIFAKNRSYDKFWTFY